MPPTTSIAQAKAGGEDLRITLGQVKDVQALLGLTGSYTQCHVHKLVRGHGRQGSLCKRVTNPKRRKAMPRLLSKLATTPIPSPEAATLLGKISRRSVCGIKDIHYNEAPSIYEKWIRLLWNKFLGANSLDPADVRTEFDVVVSGFKKPGCWEGEIVAALLQGMEIRCVYFWDGTTANQCQQHGRQNDTREQEGRHRRATGRRRSALVVLWDSESDAPPIPAPARSSKHPSKVKSHPRSQSACSSAPVRKHWATG